MWQPEGADNGTMPKPEQRGFGKGANKNKPSVRLLADPEQRASSKIDGSLESCVLCVQIMG